jgi:acetyl-CoA carboxylase biotin carboxyl carrier protein
MSQAPSDRWDPDDLTRVLRAIDESGLIEVEIEYGQLRLRVRKDGADDRFARDQTQQSESQPEVKSADLANLSGQRIEVRAPMLGVFYRAPEPGAPPFVQVGQTVGAKDTVGLIEVMKLFNQVPAGVDGRIVDIRVQDAAFVEHGQVLIVIETHA